MHWTLLTTPAILASSLVYAHEENIKQFMFLVDTQKVEPAPGLVRTKTVVNGQFPGPLLRVPYGATVSNTVTNLNPINGTSIHWHGMHQNGTPWYDGFASQNQCGIPPLHSLTYTFSATDQSGTAWWHAHFAEQDADGVFGPLIIEDSPAEFPYEYDEERTVLMTDVYDRTSWQLVDYLQEPIGNGSAATDPTPDWGLVCLYGEKGWDETRAKCSCGTSGEGFTMNFVPGRTYRLRLIGASVLAPFLFSIDGHEMRLVKTDLITLDGNTIITELPLYTGQRYDVLVTARTDVQPGETFWLRASMMSYCWPAAGNLTTDVRGIIQYISPPSPSPPSPPSILAPFPSLAPSPHPLSPDTPSPFAPSPLSSRPKTPTSQAHNSTTSINNTQCNDPPLTLLTPLVPPSSPISTTPAITLLVNYTMLIDPRTDALISVVDGSIYDAPLSTYPTLFEVNRDPTWVSGQDISVPNASEALASPASPTNETYTYGRNILVLPDRLRGQQARVVLVSLAAPGTHPFHLHGHDFWVLGSGVGEWSGMGGPGEELRFDNPPKRDTVVVPAAGWTVVQFTIDNPGVWAFHCHVGWHLQEGMLAQLVELPEAISQLSIPETLQEQCALEQELANIAEERHGSEGVGQWERSERQGRERKERRKLGERRAREKGKGKMITWQP